MVDFWNGSLSLSHFGAHDIGPCVASIHLARMPVDLVALPLTAAALPRGRALAADNELVCVASCLCIVSAMAARAAVRGRLEAGDALRVSVDAGVLHHIFFLAQFVDA